MKNPSTLLKTSLIALSFGITFAACNEQSSVNEISEADMAIAAEIMSTSLSDNSDGLMASVYDASGFVSQDGISYANGDGLMKGKGKNGGDKGKGGMPGMPGSPRDSSGRGFAGDATYSYDAETGVHSLEFERTMTNRQFTKTMAVSMKHIFTHESGAFVVFPIENRDSVNSIYFTSTKTGSESGGIREGNSTKIDTLSMVGLNETAELLTLNGTHNDSGYMKMTLRNGDVVERNHTVYTKLTNVVIDKALVKANQNLEEGVTGTFEYRIVTENSKNDAGEVIVEGTVEMTGDGTALMRFKGLSKRIYINLTSGETSSAN
jgi:hypothetical protein